jgi:serum/glucocorticoid-regulated kinase 2
MPFVRGGELYKIFQEQKRFPEEVVRFYIAQIIMALGELHSKGIMHRDLKLENIMVDENGYIKLIDYGLAKIIANDELAMSYCGTPEYLAPEMVDNKGHDMTVDWWAVGVLIYEMLIGVTPFFNRNRQVLMSKIRHSKIVFPDREHYEIAYSDELVDLVSGLLKKDKGQRLGAKGDATEILAHPFFSAIDTEKLLSGKAEVPFLPETDSRKSVVNSSYFNIKTGAELAESIVPKANLKAIRKNQDAFDGFYQKTAAYRKGQ